MARAGRSVAFTFAANIALAILGAAAGILVARILGPAGRGDLAAIQTFPTFLSLVAMVGLPQAVIFFTAKRTGDSGQYLGTAVALALCVSLLAGAIGYLAMPVLLAAQGDRVIEAARYYLLMIPIYAFVEVMFGA
ncbi:MAG: oligosaccharide flippase family protein, partial [Candidatus Dormibacteraeota bacterium]|nr:oligosaccharide flippase family protein [Candidatus Dormibacteraeota bacterium]